MGKTARWFRGLLGGGGVNSKKDGVSSSETTKSGKKKCGFLRSFRDHKEPISDTTSVNEIKGGASYREISQSSLSSSSFLLVNDNRISDQDQSKHAIAVAAATAAVAEAAAAVVKLTCSNGRNNVTTTAYVSKSSSSGNGGLRKEEFSALMIQSAFRGYLARRALRALKGLVKLQALVRGHIVRKKTTDTLRCMQALVRVQVRARSGRNHSSEFRYQHSRKPGPATPEKYERGVRSNSTRHDRSSSLKRNGSHSNPREMVDPQTGWNWLDHWMDENQSRIIVPPDDEKSDKILEIDPGKPLRYSSSARHASKQDRASHSYTTMDSPSNDSTTAQRSDPSTSSGEVQSVSRRKFPREVEDAVFCTSDNSPQFYSASSRPGSERRGPFTPAKSNCSRSFLSGYSDYPNYMSNTESFKAKVRSQSAPKQRLEFEKSSSTKKYSNLGFGEFRSSSTQRSSTLHTNFTRKAYPGLGRLDRLGMPVHSSHETIVNRNL